jgi:hypothetical protein
MITLKNTVKTTNYWSYIVYNKKSANFTLCGPWNTWTANVYCLGHKSLINNADHWTTDFITMDSLMRSCREYNVAGIVSIKNLLNLIQFSAVVATGYGLNDRRVEFQSISPKPTLGPNHPPIQWIPEVLSPGVKRAMHQAQTHLQLVQRSRKCESVQPLLHTYS